MTEAKSVTKQVCFEFQGDYNSLEYIKLNHGLKLNQLLNRFLNNFFESIGVSYKDAEPRLRASATMKEPGTRDDDSSNSSTEKHYYPANATYHISKYDYTYYPGEVRQDNKK